MRHDGMTEECTSWCSFCGCCEHGAPQDGYGCRAADAPTGMECPDISCGCEGTESYSPPSPPKSPNAISDSESQLHQADALFALEPELKEAS